MGLGVVRALGTQGVPVIVMHYDERDMAHVSKYVSEEIWTPHPERQEEEFIAQLLEWGGRYGDGILVPACDEMLAVVSRHKEALARCYMVACPEWAITRQFIEKKYTYALAREIGVPCPQTLIPQSTSEAEAFGKAIGYPCLVKPSQGHLFWDQFRRKMTRAEDLHELMDAYQQAAALGLEVMLQEIIPGDDAHGVNYNAYFWDGQPRAEFTAEKVRNAPPLLGSPRVAISKDIPQVIEPGRKILQAMGFYGFACTEFKRDPRDGIYKLMEVNGRHNLSSLLAVRCGINFPWLEYKHLVLGELPTQTTFQTGVYWIDLTRDLGYSIRHFAKERYSPIQYIRPYVKPHVFAILDLRDPKPFVRRSTFLVKKALLALASIFDIRRLRRSSARERQSPA
jgi:D-aspartate ligase